MGRRLQENYHPTAVTIKKSLKENKETIDFKFEPNNSFTFFHSSHTKHNAKISPFLSNFLVFLLIVSTFYQMEIYY